MFNKCLNKVQKFQTENLQSINLQPFRRQQGWLCTHVVVRQEKAFCDQLDFSELVLGLSAPLFGFQPLDWYTAFILPTHRL